ncbi:ABC-type proline/glycine betaine transport system, permease component [Saccharomonospora marina XMU15]|uniref:ABC-type proline/glycine betaine transport system, permease component n=1 Tax=Saccharomonospora marina XMU15 TaxID=882083 RepID=H5X6Q3_9PSEU|nr:proline/glycine betaine ABC transporter permease [Saccharomonospora marina]EHR51274.1 ABC-type proline/glycine betaine transport system, permease component [Saccharomonospora marina XMU15]
MDEWRIPLGEWVDDFVDWLLDNFRPVLSGVRDFLVWSFEELSSLLTLPPALAMIAILGALAWLARGWKLGIGGALSLLFIMLIDQWDNAMQTLALVIITVVVAAVLAIPIGILAARYRVVSNLLRPVLDLMQTMPPLVYLIPGVVLIGVGPQAGMVATVIFAMPPGIRLTELGIRQVDSEVVEAGHAFGSTPGAILRNIQLPLAMPTIMAGINQVIMLSLSMVVLAGFVGAPGLGQQVLSAISQLDVGLGVEAGLSVVILAIYLDRVTAALGSRSAVARLQKTA